MTIHYVLYAHGFGTQGVAVAPGLLGPLAVTSGILMLWCNNIIRISMAALLLRLQDSQYWRWPLTSLIVVQICLIVVATTVQLAICRPLSGVWAPTPNTKCIPANRIVLYGDVYNGECRLWIAHAPLLLLTRKRPSLGFNVASDIFVSLMPLTFIRRMQRPFSEKVLLAGLMASGLGASTVAVVRLATLNRTLVHTTKNQTLIELLVGMEMMLLVIAANIPLIKGPIHRVMKRCGLVKPTTHTADAGQSSFLGRMKNYTYFILKLEDLRRPSGEEHGSGRANRRSSPCPSGAVPMPPAME